MNQGNQPGQGGNSPITFVAIIIGVIVIGAVAYKAMHKETPATDANTTNATATAESQAGDKSKVQPREPGTSVQSAPATAPAPAPTPETKAPVTGPAKDLVTSLASLDPKKGPITKEQAEKFKADLKALVAQGKDAVPAIREFLERNVELSYANAGGESLGYKSLRSSLIDALAQIGGPDATTALLGTLNTTALPGEIAQLAKALEQVAPGQYSGDVLNAARQTLELAMGGGLGKEDAGPLFDIISKAAANGQLDPSLLADLQKSAQNYKWYPLITLANLPNGQGVDSIIALSKDPNAPNTVPEMLGQLALQNDKALDALLDLARADRITPNEWQAITDALMGKKYSISSPGTSDPTQPSRGIDCQFYHIEYNNQNFQRCSDPNFVPKNAVDVFNKILGVVRDPNLRSSFQSHINTLQSGGK
jgi:hypothetical protein